MSPVTTSIPNLVFVSRLVYISLLFLLLTRCSFILSLCVPKSIDYKTSMVSSEDRNVPFLAFEPLSYVPIQVDCCNIEDLTAEEVCSAPFHS